ncbi:MAG: DUF3102 domain-containing protein [Peptococcaceae bacterium]|nr:DUF3102 domain-containing protein [Peptococcaceae bacterium]
MANEMITLRTPLMIAAEINAIKYQTGKILLANTIEIGRRLTEAKALLEYGEWGKWLEDEGSYSQKTAENLMRIYEAYGSKQPVSLNAGAQSPEIPNLSYTQAFILLGVPEEERAEFIAEMDVGSMSTRELQKAVKERKQALEEREQAFQDRDQALQEKADLRKALDEQSGQITRLTEERDNLKTEANGLRESKRALEQEVEKKKSDLNKIKKNTASEAIQKMSNNLTAAYNRAAANKVAFLYESLEKTFKELAYEMTEFAPVDPEVHAAYKKR